MFIIDIFLSLIYYILYLYMICFFVRGALTLVGADPYNKIVGFLSAITDPLRFWLLKKMPRLLLRNSNGQVYDLSLLACMVILGAIMMILRKSALHFGFYI